MVKVQISKSKKSGYGQFCALKKSCIKQNLTIHNARGKIFLTKERAVEHTFHAKKENPELALGVFCAGCEPIFYPATCK